MTLNALMSLIKTNSDILFTVGELFGLGATVVTVNKAAPKAKTIIERDKGEGYTKRMIFKDVVPVYVPSMIAGGGTAALMIIHLVSTLKNKAALTSAVMLAEGNVVKYQDKITEMFGKDKANEIKSEIVHDDIRKNKPFSKEPENLIEGTGLGNELFYDMWSGRYFYCSMEAVNQAAAKFNQQIMTRDTWKEVNEFYEMIHLKPVECGKNVGYNIDRPLEFDTMPGLTDVGDKSFIALNLTSRPLTYDGRHI